MTILPGMRQALKLHPDLPCGAATHIEVDVALPHPGSLVLCYFVTGQICDLRIPPAATAARTGELWQHTCFEAFIGTPEKAAYYEFNFAPSTQWAAYRFSSYRSGMCIATEIGTPEIEVQWSPQRFTLRASLAFDWSSRLPRDAGWRLGLSALIEETSGRKSHWALAHPPGKADFHHSDCFAMSFP